MSYHSNLNSPMNGVGFFGEGFTPWPDRSGKSKAQVVGVLSAGAGVGYLLAAALGAKPGVAAGSAVAGLAVAYFVGSAVARGTWALRWRDPRTGKWTS